MKDFERNMELLADTESHGRGRWIISPRKGMAFVGPRARAKARARERRRRVFVFLLESIVLTLLIGIVPPLRAMWYATGALLALLAMYLWILVSVKQRGAGARSNGRVRVAGATATARAARHRHVAEGQSRNARPAINGLAAVGEPSPGPIVVRRAGRISAAGV